MIAERVPERPPPLEAARERLRRALFELPCRDRLGRDVRLETAVYGLDPTPLFASTDVFPQALFASSRSGRRVCAFGAARRFSLPAHASAGELVSFARAGLARGTGPLVGAARFSPAHDEGRVDPAWAPFGGGLFFLPRLLLEERGGEAVLALHLCGDRALEEERAAALAALSGLGKGSGTGEAPAPEGAGLLHERARFAASVERALACFSDRALEKVVLARRAERPLREPRQALARALATLEAKEPFGASYLLALAPDEAWLGKSPELLLRRRGAALWSEAVAGTRPRGREPGEDARLAAELLASDKDAREHRLVKEHVESALCGLGLAPRAAEAPELRRLSRVMHLVSPVEADVAENVADGALVDALHPTPAIAGVPTRAALRFLEEREGFDRGLYAGPVGLLDEDGLELWIGLRGARLSRGVLTLYAGAGIVEGSDPDAEWRETEAKASALLAAFGGER